MHTYLIPRITSTNGLDTKYHEQAAVALGLVMAGSGDLGAFRLLRELRWRVDAEVTYGDHMALHMAIGAYVVVLLVCISHTYNTYLHIYNNNNNRLPLPRWRARGALPLQRGHRRPGGRHFPAAPRPHQRQPVRAAGTGPILGLVCICG